MHPRFYALLIALGLAGFVASDALFVVDQREMVVIRQLGQYKQSINEPGHDDAGLHFKMPFIQELIRLDRRVLALDMPATEVLMGEDPEAPQQAATPDDAALPSVIPNQEADQRPRLVVDTFVRYRITNARDFIITTQSEDRLPTLLRPVVDDAVRGVLGRYSLRQLLSEQRGAIIGEIAKRVNDVASGSKYGIEIIDVRIRRADFPDRALEAVYGRMRSERERVASQTLAEGEQRAQAIRAAADRERVEILATAQRDSQILRGDADSEAIKTLGAANGADPGFYSFYRSLQAYRTALTPTTTTLVLTPDSEFFRYFGRDNTASRNDRR